MFFRSILSQFICSCCQPVKYLPSWLLPGYRAPDGGYHSSSSSAGQLGGSQYHSSSSSSPAFANQLHLMSTKPGISGGFESVPLSVQQQQQQQQEATPLDRSQLSITALTPPSDPVLDPLHNCLRTGCQRVIINVSGQRFETQLRTLSRFPDTLLGNATKRVRYWDERRNEFFLDRHRPSFQAILYYYQSGGRLQRPIEVPEDIFLQELQFYEIGEQVIHDYKVKEGFVMEVAREMPGKPWQRSLWLLCEEPNSSRVARVFAVISVVCIVTTIVSFCIETIPELTPNTCNTIQVPLANGSMAIVKVQNYNEPFFIIETVCVVWFTLEFIARFVSCPSKRRFCRHMMNMFDVLAILPYFIIMTTVTISGSCEQGKKGGMFIVIRVLRVFRIFKLSKHSQGLRILGLTIKTSLRELGMFFFFLIIAMVIFSSAVYYAEIGEPGSQMTSIPGAFWWAIVSMTTVGYGDVTPVGVWAKLVGTLCVIAGVLTIALPVPVVVANFNNFYRHENGRGYISA